WAAYQDARRGSQWRDLYHDRHPSVRHCPEVDPHKHLCDNKLNCHPFLSVGLARSACLLIRPSRLITSAKPVKNSTPMSARSWPGISTRRLAPRSGWNGPKAFLSIRVRTFVLLMT